MSSMDSNTHLLNPSSNETLFSETTLSSDMMDEDTMEFVFNDNPLGMSFPMTTSLSISQSILPTGSLCNHTSFPSLPLDCYLPEMNEAESSFQFLSPSEYSPPAKSTSMKQMELSTPETMSIDFDSGPLPQGSIRNIEMPISTNDDLLTKINQDYPFPSISQFDHPFLPESSDEASDLIDFSESDYLSDANVPCVSSKKKAKSHRKTKKWSCSECRYLNNLSRPLCFKYYYRNKAMSQLRSTIALHNIGYSQL